MKYIQILKWAAGATTSIPDDLEFDVPRLLDLIAAHNLSGRCLQRTRESNPHWATPELVDGLELLHAETKQMVFRNIAAFGELRRQLYGGTHIMLVKGVSTYILSEREETMRAGDIDLLSNNPYQVVQALLNLGHLQTRAPFMHEIGEYARDGIEFDIHAYFPVYSYTKALLDADLVPSRNTGIWQQNYQFEQSEITFDSLERDAHYGRQPDTSQVVVADPNLSAVIICAHAFMNYTNLWSISHREKAYVRLAEIADLFDLATHPSFGRERFLAEVDFYRAHDAVEWAASVAISIFGRNPLPVPVLIGFDDPLPSSRFPRCLWWNFWASLSSATDDLLRTQWLSMDWLIEQLGANRCSVQEGEAISYATVKTEDGLPLARYITQLPEPVPILLQVKKYDGGLMIYLQVHTLPRVDIERIRIDLGNIASEWIYKVKDDHQLTIGSPVAVSFARSDRAYQLTIEFSRAMLGLSDTRVQPVALLIGVARQTDSDGLIASILIPLLIEL